MSASIAGMIAATTVLPASVSAQAVVQPLPPRAAGDLNDALRRLARSPRDLGALLDAGEASLAVGDLDAAIGFFVRGQDVAPENGRVMLGLARCFTLQRRPIEALRLFAEAEQAGIAESEMAADRGLAFDLVGDNASAQALYRAALAQGNDPETRRRLALSLAMTGQRKEFEATLLPLLQSEDRSAFRARAFGLAILGDADDAVGIAEALMPTDLALRMAPYLRYMPRLTRAQQAAAANLGAFPRANEIGRDDPAIASYGPSESRIARGPDAALAPSGVTMGTNANANAGATPVATPTPAPAPQRQTRQQRRQAERSARTTAASDPLARTLARSTPAATPERAVAAPPPVPAPFPAPTPAPAQSPVAVAQATQPAIQLELPPSNDQAASDQVAPVQTSSAPVTEAPAQIVRIDPSPVATSAEIVPATPVREEPVQVAALSVPTVASPAPSMVAPTETTPDPEPSQSVADAFAAFAATQPAAMPRPGTAVDITTIKPPRERAAPPPPAPEAKPKPPANPSRHYVQIATGRDRDALKFDWRRISRKADSLLDGKGPFVTKWVEANRLLAGPYPSAAAAREVMNKLKALDIDSFTFTSDPGQSIDKLD